MRQYLDLLKDILEYGEEREDRTGVGTLSVFGRQMRFDLTEGFPILTTKKVNFKAVVGELLWFLSGSTNVKDLHKNNIHIWDAWANKYGDLGLIYGHQWRKFGESCDYDGYDQISELVKGITDDPYSRRHVVTAWAPDCLEYQQLPPCHILFQCYVSEHQELSLQVYQRSADMFLGVPFNISSYALLTHLIAIECGLSVGELIWVGGDCHIYKNHIEQVLVQLTREPKKLPVLGIKSRLIKDFSSEYMKYNDIFSHNIDDFELLGYNPHEAIKGDIAV